MYEAWVAGRKAEANWQAVWGTPVLHNGFFL